MKKIFFLLQMAFLYSPLFSQNGLTTYDDTKFGTVDKLRKVAIVCDLLNNKWIGYQSLGLCKFDGTNFQFFNITNSSIPSNRVNDISIKDNNLCIATDSGIALFDQNTWTIYNKSNGLPDNCIYGVYYDGKKIYAISGTKNLSIFDGSSWNNVLIPDTFSITSLKPLHILKDSKGNIWFGSNYKGGLYKYDGISFSSYFNNFNNRIVGLCEDNSEYIWASVINDINIIKPDTVVTFQDAFPDEYPYPSSYAIYKAKNGNIYCFNNERLYEIIKDKVNIFVGINLGVNYTYKYDDITIDNNNIIWIITDKQNIFSFDPSKHSNFGLAYTKTNHKYLDVSKVKAGYYNRGRFFGDHEFVSEYEVPKGTRKTATSITGLWIGGLDDNLKIHIAAAGFLNDYWPGPLDTTNASIDTATADKYDIIWKVDKYNILEFKYMFNNGYVANGQYKIPDNILSWPAQGIGNHAKNLAPFVDYNNDGIYNPMDGDYPEIKGDQMLYWIMNDNLTTHGTKRIPLGIEVHASAYAYRYDNPPCDSLDLINYQTFGSFKIFNRSDTAYHDVYAGIFSSAELGEWQDDYIGCDVKHNSFYNYNGTPFDGSGQYNAYGKNPPVFCITILDGPLADVGDGIDNDRDSILDEPEEKIGLSKFISFNWKNKIIATQEPKTPIEYYHYLQGIWKDSSNLFYGGLGHKSDTNTTNDFADFIYPGSSDPFNWGTNGKQENPWSEYTFANLPNDRDGVGSMGPFTLKPGESKEFTVLYGFFRDTMYHPDGLESFSDELERIINWYKKGTIPSNYLDSLNLGGNDYKTVTETFNIFPNPSAYVIYIENPNNNQGYYTIYDMKGSLYISGKVHDTKLTKIDIENLPDGMYILKVTSDKKTISRKFIKK